MVCIGFGDNFFLHRHFLSKITVKIKNKKIIKVHYIGFLSSSLYKFLTNFKKEDPFQKKEKR